MRKTVLVVEDDAINRAILDNILSKEYDVLKAQDGAQALQCLKEASASVAAVLLDIVMPVMDGFETLARIRGDGTLASIPVIIATASQSAADEARALSLGANDFIQKPYNSTLILHSLRNAILLRETASLVNALQRDRLTGLYTRETFFALAEDMIKAHPPGYYIVSCLDVDQFKVLNDQYGTQEGDRILKHIAQTMSDLIGSVDGICCRISSDNFAMIYPSDERAVQTIERLRSHGMQPPDVKTVISISTGRYIVTDLTLTMSAMYDRAYLAKQSVKGRYDQRIAYFDESMRAKLLRDQSIVAQMNDALKNGQFELYIQPQINHATGALIGAEALIRWRHPEKGLIPPGVFIPVFEQNGFIYELDKFVWEEACRLLRKWLNAGRKPLPISINLSRYDALRPDVIEVLIALIKKYSLSVDLLRLEITESAFSVAPERIISVVRRMKRFGFMIEIDDFGSGYSSLNTLKDVPADVLKLDMRFLENTDCSQRGGNILESVVRMAKWLDMSVIAEGVETLDQADYLKSIGCNYIQGFLYSRPIPVAEFEAYAPKVIKEQRLLRMETVENLDNNTFWDPASMDTLIFNSYVGGACIIEVGGEATEVLRANDRCAKALGGTDMTLEDVLRLQWKTHMDEATQQAFIAATKAAIETGEDVSGEYMLRGVSGRDEETWLRITMRMIASAGERYLMYATLDNITAQHEAERKERQANHELHKADEQFRFLSGMAHNLLAQPDSESSIQETLQKLMEYFDGDRACVYETDPGGLTISATYKAQARGTKAPVGDAHGIPLHIFACCVNDFETQSYSFIGDVSALDDARLDKKLLLERGITSLVAVPLKRDGALIGLMGIYNPKRRQTSASRLSALGDYFAVMLTRRDLGAKILRDKEMLENLINDMPGGFARVLVKPGGALEPIYLNKGLCALVGLEHDALIKRFTNSTFSPLTPDDAAIVKKAIAQMLRTGEASSEQFQLKRESGETLWLMIFGRKTEDLSGETYLNIYVTDMSQQHRLEAQRVELLDNLPCGAALYDWDGERLTALHLNKRYRELVSRELADLRHVSVINTIHPDDRAILITEIRLALQEHRDIDCSLRVEYGSNGYRAFHCIGRAVPREEGHDSIYACYQAMGDEEISYQQMLPIALKAVIGASPDMAFVKDRNGRYICTSRQFALSNGIDEQSIIGKNDYDFMEKRLADQFDAMDRLIIQTGEPLLNYDSLQPSKDNVIRYASTSKYPLMDSSGCVIGIYGVVRDTTEYRTAFERLKLLTDSIPGGIASLEVTPESVRLISFNEGYYAFSGYSREEYALQCQANPLFIVLQEDWPIVRAVAKSIRAGKDEITRCVYRCRVKDGGYRWMSTRGMVSLRRGDTVIVNTVQFDITEQKETEERLRVSENLFRVAANLGERTVGRYDIRTKVYYNNGDLLTKMGFASEIPNVPEAFIQAGTVDPSSEDDFRAFYERVRSGAQSTSATVCLMIPGGAFHWFRLDATSVPDESGMPAEAVIVFCDVTEQREKEAIYKKWQQSLMDKPPESYTLFRCNLSLDASFDSVEGSLLKIAFPKEHATFNRRTEQYAMQCVHPADRASYIMTLDSDALLAGYYRGRRKITLEYRELVDKDSVRWLRLTAELVEYPDSTDVEAYLLYEDIDTTKQAELHALALAELDPLTGVLNRYAFAKRMHEQLRRRKAGTLGVLIMFDIDGFKLVNDSYGHVVGDQALAEMADTVKNILRPDDLSGRLGGDEFLIYLHDMPSRAAIVKKARQICATVRRSFSVEISISASLGIAMCPDNGEDFNTLYHKADIALYHVKTNGKNSFEFYEESMRGEMPRLQDGLLPSADENAESGYEHPKLKRRMLIVDDSRIEREMLTGIFENEFIIDTADDGQAALIRLRRCGASVSVVLLDLIMPGMDGFAMLEKMRQSAELRNIPVVVVSAMDESEASLHAIRCGASDFVTKPIHADLLRLRVRSAISKTESERLRAQNMVLTVHSREVAKYRAVLEDAAIAMIEYDAAQGVFVYDDMLPNLVRGKYDHRPLWQIFAEDDASDADEADRVRAFITGMAAPGAPASQTLAVTLKTPSGKARAFALRGIAPETAPTVQDHRVLLTLREQA